MKMKAGLSDLLWMAAGAVIMLALTLTLLHARKQQDPSAQLAFKARRIELVEQMRLALASASEAEKSAVMATTDQESQILADQSRADVAALERELRDIESLLQDRKAEQALLAQFASAFTEFRRVDKEILDLAVQNTNLKAYGLAFGPAADAIGQMDAALGRLAQDANSPSVGIRQVMRLADDARIAALRILSLLAPHIAEESDQKMSELEARMALEDAAVRKDFDGLAALMMPADNADLRLAVSRYMQFSDLRAQIVKLSRENTNVRSLTMSLNQKRKVMGVCQDALAALEQAIQQEPVAGEDRTPPVHPR
jgi:hypothetical protein